MKKSNSCRKLRYHILRKSEKRVDSFRRADYYDGPITRSMKCKTKKDDLVEGLKDEQDVRRVVYSVAKKVL